MIYTRPSQINHFAKQRAIIDAPTRYTITEGSTKSGKTVSHIVWLFEQALAGKEGQNFWWVAPIFSQAKIAFRRLKRFISDKDSFTANESELSITIRANGAVIMFKSAENPDSLYGEDVYAAVLDEVSRMREESWFAIRSTVTATGGKVKMIGNVKGTGNWSYQMARKAESGLRDWSYFKLTAADAVEAGVLHQQEIDDARAVLPEGIFLELYYAIPFENSSNKFAFAFSEKRHVKECRYNPLYPLYLSFDFNRNPICCAAIQHYEGVIRVIALVKLENSDIYRLCAAIRNKFPDALFLVCGDASGRNKSAMVKDDLNYFLIIKDELDLSASQMQQLGSNPSIEDNQVLLNAILEHYPVEIDPSESAALVFDLKFVEMRADGTIKKADREDPTQQADALDCFRYYLQRYHREFIRIRMED